MSVTWHQTTHGVPRKQAKVNRATASLLIVGILVITLVVGAYLALVASTIRISGEIWSLHNQMGEIQRENSRLQTEIARLSSIPVLQVRSAALGYEPAESVEYLPVRSTGEVGAP